MPTLSIYNEEQQEWNEVKALKGSAATIEVGEVSTLPENSFAYVKNSGNEREAVLDFGLPRGANGITPVRGTDYWTAEDQKQIIDDVSEKLDFQFQKLMNAILNKPATYIFKNKAELDSAITLENDTIQYQDEERKLNPGDIFLLTDQDEPDYWYGEDSSGNKLHELEARKIDLSDYIQKNNMVLITYDEYEALLDSGSVNPDTFYYVYEG